MYSEGKHLSPDQVEWLIKGKGSEAVGAAPVEFWDDAHQHLAQCTACEELVRLHGEIEKRLDTLKGQPGQPLSEDCPDQKIWWEVAAGILPDARADELMDHATICEHCRPLFRDATTDITAEIGPSEELALSRLTSAMDSWQRSLAERLSKSRRPETHSINSHPKIHSSWMAMVLAKSHWVFAISACALVLLGAFLITRHNQESSVDDLLAKAYTKQRTLELRIASANYGPMAIQRGKDGSRLDRPTELLEAETLISKNLQLKPEDPHLLQEKGESDLLEGNVESARVALEVAHHLEPDDESISIDLAIADFERAALPNSAVDYNATIDLLRRVTVKNPGNVAAWFNLAVACERAHYFAEALRAWDNYLKLDDSSGWAIEAKTRRESLLKRIEEKNNESNRPLLDPTTIAGLHQHGGRAEFADLDERIESYLDMVVTSWLPKAISQMDDAGQSSPETVAIQTVSDLALQRHQDKWLRDLVDGLRANQVARAGATTLSKAARLNASGEYIEAHKTASESSEIFRKGNSIPGLLRARFEEVYASHLSQHGDTCFTEAIALLNDLRDTSYVWLEIQTQLEVATCANMTGRVADADTNAKSALEASELHNYHSLFLRATLEMAVFDWSRGDFRTAATLANSGLEKFWSGHSPYIRGYSLYTVLDSIAEDSEQWFAQVAVTREATTLIANNLNHGLLAFEYQRVGSAALRSGEFDVAQEYFEKSEREFSLSPSSESVGIFRAGADIGMARMDYLKSNFALAAQKLEDALPVVRATSNRFLALDYYLTAGDVFQSNGQPERAEQAILDAIGIAEKGLRTIANERERFVWTRNYSRAYRSLVNLELQKDADHAFQLWEWYKGAPSSPLKFGDQAPADGLGRNVASRVLQSRRERGPNMLMSGPSDNGSSLLISYVFLPGEVGAWSWNEQGVRYLRLSLTPKVLENVAGRFARACANPKSNEKQIERDARTLFNVLMRPFMPVSTPRNVVIEPDGILNAVPFEVLIDEKGNFLGDDVRISISPGVKYLFSTREVIRASKPFNSLVVENQNPGWVLDNRLQQIPSAASEARQVARTLPNATLLSGKLATSDAIMRGIRAADLFHFSGHALSTVNGSVLVLGPEPSMGSPDLLDAVRLEKATVNRTRLVVLSACATAGFGVDLEDDPSSLARAFIASGVPQVIASRWSVDSDSTERLMESFYRHLLSGTPVGNSLRDAKIDLRNSLGYSHPYYWSGFSVFGKPQ